MDFEIEETKAGCKLNGACGSIPDRHPKELHCSVYANRLFNTIADASAISTTLLQYTLLENKQILKI